MRVEAILRSFLLILVLAANAVQYSHRDVAPHVLDALRSPSKPTFELVELRSLSDVHVDEVALGHADKAMSYILVALIRIPFVGDARLHRADHHGVNFTDADAEKLRNLVVLECSNSSREDGSTQGSEVVAQVHSLWHSGVGDADSAFFPGLAAHLSWGLEPLARTRPDVAVPPQRRPSALNKVLSAAADTADSKGSNDLVLSLVLALRSGHQGRNKTARSKYDAADKVSSATTPHGDVFVVNPLLAPALANESAYYKGSMSLPSLFSQMLQQQCRPRLLRAAEQTQWPPGQVVVRRPNTLPTVLEGTLGLLHRSCWDDKRSAGCSNATLVRRINSVHIHGLTRNPAARSSASNHHLNKYPDIARSWSPVVPPMPNYCGLQNGTLHQEVVKDLRAHHENVFLEADTKQRGRHAQFPMAMKIIKALISLLMPPVMDPITSQIMPQAALTIGDVSGHDVDGIVPLPVIDRLSRSLRYNLTNLLTASLSRTLTDTLTSSLTMKLGPRISAEVHTRVLPELQSSILESLTRAIPAQLEQLLPESLAQSLPPVVTQRITRVVTHALVPTLSMALSHTSQQDRLCNMCFHHRQHCSECQYSAASQYYTNYYSDYYSDFYAEYYGTYYSNAMSYFDHKLEETVYSDQNSWRNAFAKPPKKEVSKTVAGRSFECFAVEYCRKLQLDSGGQKAWVQELSRNKTSSA